MIEAQPGAQTAFLSSQADIVVYGGAAGGGKTFALLLEAVRHSDKKDFGAVIFRRTTVQVRNKGGLWDESQKLYPLLNASARAHTLDWRFPSGATIAMRHLEHEKNVFDWQGAQIPLICFDELTHFSETQFWYMLSRNRSTCGVTPYVRATCNPDPNSFLVTGPDGWGGGLISWWMDTDGFPIAERGGAIRYFARVNDRLVMGDSADEVSQSTGFAPELIKSLSFIPAKVFDNRALLDANPEYLANLQSLSYIDRERLLNGNWKISADGGVILAKWLQYYSSLPVFSRIVQSWDVAVKDNDLNSFSVCTTWGVAKDGYYLIDIWRARREYPEIRAAAIAQFDKHRPHTVLIEDKASGQALIQELRRSTRIPILPILPRNDKVTRIKDVSVLFESGRVFLPARAAWLADYTVELTTFPLSAFNDQVDSTSQALHYLRRPSGGESVFTVKL